MIDQYEHLIKIKDDELFKFKNDCQKYIATKKDEMRKARKEIVELYEIIKR